MPPRRLSTGKFKTITIDCKAGHEVARYRKPRSEQGHRTHKLWLLEERIGRLTTEPPILVENPKTGKNVALSVIAALRKMHSPLAVGT